MGLQIWPRHIRNWAAGSFQIDSGTFFATRGHDNANNPTPQYMTELGTRSRASSTITFNSTEYRTKTRRSFKRALGITQNDITLSFFAFGHCYSASFLLS
jgi:hypothetical protein